MANMNFGVNILPKANNTYSLGNSDYKWNIFANTLNGISLTNIITDIQVDGTSIISDNIATLPVASANSYGVIKIGTGLYTNNDGVLFVNAATSFQIKSEASSYVPIVPKNQHEAVFYGLAKAAGDSTQSASSNAVGTYTDSAKTAIQSMLDIPNTTATTSANGLMAAEDKSKLDDIDIIDIDKTVDTPATVQTFSDGADNLPMEVTVGLEPVQDLHGYSNPWVGGAGKNLCPVDQINFVPSASWVNLNNGGASTYTSGTKLHLNAGTYYVTLEQTSNVNSFQIFDASGNFLRNSASAGSFTLSSEQDTYIRVKATDTSTAIKFKIQVESGSSGTSWVPYENICPISGWDKAEVTRTGKNLFGFGHNVIDRTAELRANVSQRFDVEALGTNRAKFTSKGTWSVAYLTIKGIDGTKDYNVHFDIEYNDTELTPAFNKQTAYSDEHNLTYSVVMNNSASKSGKYFILNNIMLEEGSTASAYEPFGRTYSIIFPSSAGTVYGGSLTVNKDGTGTLVMDRAIHDFGDFTYTYESSYTRFRSSTISGQEIPAASRTGQGVCSCYQVLTHAEAITDVPNGSIYNGGSSGNPVVWIHDSRYTDPTEFKTALTGQKFVFKLATASTYTIPALVIRSLLGTNNIWVNNGGQEILSITYGAETAGLITTEDKVKLDNINIIDPYATLDAPTDIVEIEGAAAAVKEIDIAIAPLQDLHGYDHPWVGGAGKNLCPMTLNGLKSGNTSGTWSGNAYTKNDITFTVITDSDDNVTGIKANGTASAETIFYCGSYILKAGDSIKYNGSTGGTTSTYWIVYHGYSKAPNGDGTADRSSATSDWDERLELVIANGVTVTNQMFYPMIRMASETDTSYAPYSNICPINGWTGANTTVKGIELYNSSITIQRKKGVNSTTGALETSDYYDCFGMFDVEQNTGYEIKAYSGNGSGGIGAYFYKADGTYISRIFVSNDGTAGNKTIYATTPSNCKKMYVSVARIATMAVDESRFQLHRHNVYSISFTSSAGTVYGGTLTVNQDGTGALVIDKKMRVLNGSESYTKSGSGVIPSGRSVFYVNDSTFSDAKASGGDSNQNKVIMISSHGRFLASYNTCLYSEKGLTFGVGVNSNYTDVGISISSDIASTASEMKTWLSLNNIQIVYPLATASTYALTTDQVVHLLSGQNTVYADCGDIQKLVYVKETSGLLSASDKSKLDNIQEGAAVKDVQINGTSILNNKIANIPIASTSNYGAVKVGGGLYIYDNCLCINEANSNQIKAGTVATRPIVPYNQHQSVFYGLAKAAGDSTQAASNNAVGTYTADAKSAIQNMLGITSMTGATSSVAGASGLVPAPTTGDVDKFLAGDGTYKSGGLPMVILSYGNSTWAEFEAAYNNNVIVYCRASSNSNPASGSQTRMAFMAYVNNATTPTEVEFQYYRSMSSHSATAMGDQVFVYKLTKTGGWSVTTRDASIKQIKMATDSAGSVSWSSNVVTLDSGLPAVTASDNGKILKVVDGAWAVVDP